MNTTEYHTKNVKIVGLEIIHGAPNAAAGNPEARTKAAPVTPRRSADVADGSGKPASLA